MRKEPRAVVRAGLWAASCSGSSRCMEKGKGSPLKSVFSLRPQTWKPCHLTLQVNAGLLVTPIWD